MNQVTFQRVKQVFLRLLDVPANERRRALRTECGGDDALAREVESLLASHLGEGDFLLEPALGPLFSVAEAFTHSQQVQAGPYRGVAVIGSGASAIVYRAKHLETGLDVALKVLRPGVSAAKAVDRFRNESDALRRLRHPQIATIYETGSTSVLGAEAPWIAMELVHGRTLLQHVHDSGASLRDVLNLLADLAETVHFAHERHVVHADLKPANVLVTDSGKIKVVDFGVARIVGREYSGAARSGGGTLGYTEPERVGPQPEVPTTASDVYALGAIAYELLTGRLPLDWTEGQPQPLQAKVTSEPWPLGALRPELRGDVETIVHHALAVKASARCPSAGFFAAELRRFLAGEPIQSPRPSLLRRMRRFSRTHRGIVVGITATFVALTIGIVSIGNALSIATNARTSEREQREIAESRLSEATAARQEAEQVSGFLTDLLRAPLDVPRGQRPDLETLFVDLAARMSKPSPEGAQRSAMFHALGMSLFALGRFDLAEQQIERAWQLASKETPDATRRLQSLQVDWAVTELQAGHTLAASHRLTKVAADIGSGPFTDSLRLRCQYNRALAAHQLGESDEAQQILDEALPELPDAMAHDSLVLSLRSLAGAIASERKDHVAATAIYEQCLTAAITHLGETHPRTLELRNNLGLELLEVGRIDDGAKMLEQAVEGRRQRHGDAHPETLQSLHNLASLRLRQGRVDEALALSRETAAGRVRVLGKEHPRTLVTQNNLARLLEQQGDAEEAETLFRETLAGAERALPPGHLQVVTIRSNLARLLTAAGRDSEAKALIVTCLQDTEARLGPDHARTRELRLRLRRLEAKIEKH